MRCLGQDPSDADVRRLFGEVDVDGSGEISFEEFLEIMQSQVGTQNDGSARSNKEFTRNDWAHAFNVFDLNRDGYITAEELGAVLNSMGESLKDFELQEMVQEVCTDGSGKLTLDMFITVMTKGIQTD
jgi:Ca2+-binding EF-hand superfamily protein